MNSKIFALIAIQLLLGTNTVPLIKGPEIQKATQDTSIDYSNEEEEIDISAPFDEFMHLHIEEEKINFR